MIDRLYEPVPVGAKEETLNERCDRVLAEVTGFKKDVDLITSTTSSSDIMAPAVEARESLARFKTQVAELDARITAIAAKLEPQTLLHTLLTNPQIAAIVDELRKDALKARPR
jgi:hypothetical protein